MERTGYSFHPDLSLLTWVLVLRPPLLSEIEKESPFLWGEEGVIGQMLQRMEEQKRSCAETSVSKLPHCGFIYSSQRKFQFPTRSYHLDGTAYKEETNPHILTL